jgi:hypothetical protein
MIEETEKRSHIPEPKAIRHHGIASAKIIAKAGEYQKITEELLDTWRILLVDLAYLLSSYFVDVQYWEGVKSKKDTFDQLMRTLRKLSQMPDHDGTILIRFRGFPSGEKISEKSDYMVLFGHITVDKAIANAVSYRQGIHMPHLSGRLARSFGIFSQQGISTLYLKINELSSADLERLCVCLHIISQTGRRATSTRI